MTKEQAHTKKKEHENIIGKTAIRNGTRLSYTVMLLNVDKIHTTDKYEVYCTLMGSNNNPIIDVLDDVLKLYSIQ